MRVLYIGFNEQEARNDLLLIRKNITSKYNDCIIIDTFGNDIEQLETALYCMEIRRYDLVFIYFDSAVKNKYYSLLGIINKIYEHKVSTYFICGDAPNDIGLISFKTCVANDYPNLDVHFIEEGMNDNELASFIAQNCEFFFVHELRFRNITLNPLDKTVTVHSDTGTLTMYLERPYNFLVLSYFLRHYGQTISFNDLMSAIYEEPEQSSEGLVENAIFTIRKIFKKFKINPIISMRSNNYQFNLNGVLSC